jgi:hypothetical protein
MRIRIPAIPVNADPDPTFHFNAGQDPAFPINVDPDPDPAFHFNADPDPDPAPHQSDVNLQPLVYKPL